MRLINYYFMELLIGRVIKSHGIKGEVAVELTTDQPEKRFRVGEAVRAKQSSKERSLTISSLRPHQGRLLIKFAEIPDRTAADSLRGTQFFADPESDEGEEGFYDHELEGLRVIHEGEDIGEITGVSHLPRNTLLEIKLNTGSDVLIPFVHAIVPDVEVDEGYIRITPPEGLLEL